MYECPTVTRDTIQQNPKTTSEISRSRSFIIHIFQTCDKLIKATKQSWAFAEEKRWTWNCPELFLLCCYTEKYTPQTSRMMISLTNKINIKCGFYQHLQQKNPNNIITSDFPFCHRGMFISCLLTTPISRDILNYASNWCALEIKTLKTLNMLAHHRIIFSKLPGPTSWYWKLVC